MNGWNRAGFLYPGESRPRYRPIHMGQWINGTSLLYPRFVEVLVYTSSIASGFNVECVDFCWWKCWGGDGGVPIGVCGMSQSHQTTRAPSHAGAKIERFPFDSFRKHLHPSTTTILRSAYSLAPLPLALSGDGRVSKMVPSASVARSGVPLLPPSPGGAPPSPGYPGKDQNGFGIRDGLFRWGGFVVWLRNPNAVGMPEWA